MNLFTELKKTFGQLKTDLDSGTITWQDSSGPQYFLNELSQALDDPHSTITIHTTDDALLDQISGEHFTLKEGFNKRKFKKLSIKKPALDYQKGLPIIADMLFDRVGLATHGMLGSNKIMTWLAHKNDELTFGSNVSEIVHFPELLKNLQDLEKEFQDGWRANTKPSTVTLSDHSSYEIPGERNTFVKIVELPSFNSKNKELNESFKMMDILIGLAHTGKPLPGEKIDVYYLAKGKVYKHYKEMPKQASGAMVIEVKGKDLANTLLVDSLGIDPSQLDFPLRKRGLES
jgi:hypothetical protein